jgi:hypothetical protein
LRAHWHRLLLHYIEVEVVVHRQRRSNLGLVSRKVTLANLLLLLSFWLNSHQGAVPPSQPILALNKMPSLWLCRCVRDREISRATSGKPDLIYSKIRCRRQRIKLLCSERIDGGVLYHMTKFAMDCGTV